MSKLLTMTTEGDLLRAVQSGSLSEVYYSGLLSAGDAGDPLLSYLDRVLAAGGFRRYEQRHVNALAATFGPKLGLLPEIARVVVAFYAHCGFY